MKTNEMNNPLHSTALHEAAHCLAAIHYGECFDTVTIVPGEKYLGCVVVDLSKMKDSINNLIVVAAGCYAQIIAGYTTDGKVPADEGSDFYLINKVIEKRFGPDMLKPIHKEMWKDGSQLLKRNWLTLEKIAEALLEKKTLSFDEVQNIMNVTGEKLKQSEVEAKQKFAIYYWPVMFSGKYFDLSYIFEADDSTSYAVVRQEYYLNDVLQDTVDIEEPASGTGVYRTQLTDPDCGYDRVNVTMHKSIALPAPSLWSDDEFVPFDGKTATTFTETAGVGAGTKEAFTTAAIPVGGIIKIPISVTVTGALWTGTITVSMYLADSAGVSLASDALANITTAGTYTDELTLTGTGSTSARLYVRLVWSLSSAADITITIPENMISVISETKTVGIDCECLKSKATGYYLTWMNHLGGFNYWYFTEYADHIIDVTDSGETEENIFPNWPNSYGEFADTIRKQTFRTSRHQIVIRSQNLTLEQLEAIQHIKTSPLVQILNSIYDKRTVIVDTDSFTSYREGQKEQYTLSFTITYTDDIASQRV